MHWSCPLSDGIEQESMKLTLEALGRAGRAQGETAAHSPCLEASQHSLCSQGSEMKQGIFLGTEMSSAGDMPFICS